MSKFLPKLSVTQGIWLFMGLMIMFISGSPDGFTFREKSAPVFAKELEMVTGMMVVKKTAARGGSNRAYFLETPTETIRLDCFGRAASQECYPNADEDFGEELTIGFASASPEYKVVRQVWRKGKLVADEAFFDDQVARAVTRGVESRKFWFKAGVLYLAVVPIIGYFNRRRSLNSHAKSQRSVS